MINSQNTLNLFRHFSKTFPVSVRIKSFFFRSLTWKLFKIKMLSKKVSFLNKEKRKKEILIYVEL